jgi:hypothetical protein
MNIGRDAATTASQTGTCRVRAGAASTVVAGAAVGAESTADIGISESRH